MNKKEEIKARKRKAQSLMEYAFIIGIATLALTAMATYGRRGIQDVIRLSSDRLGSQEDAFDRTEEDTGGESERISEISQESAEVRAVKDGRVVHGAESRVLQKEGREVKSMFLRSRYPDINLED